MPDLNAIRRLYGAPGEGPPKAEGELRAMADVKAALDRLPPRRPDPSVIDAVVAAAGEAARPAALAPIRAVYGEEAAELVGVAGPEARALAGVKAALDALPPRRPDASVIDAVVAAAAGAAGAVLGPVRVVYEEEPEPLASEADEAEAAALAEVKAALDHLPPRRPDPSMIDAVVAAACSPPEGRPLAVAAVTGRAADRPARRDTRRRVAVALGAVFAVVLVFGGGLWLNREAPSPQGLAVTDQAGADAQVAEATPTVDGRPRSNGEQAEASEETAAAPPEAATAAPPAEAGLLAVSRPQVALAGREAPPPPARRASPSASPDVAESLTARLPAPARPDDLMLTDAEERSFAEALALDGGDELRLMYLRLREMQDAQAGLGWDTPPVSLGATPDSTPAQPATGWMQVRVRR